ncbi:MAG: class I SAM-dependent methyltransferase [Planctomycetota bacterium]|nr:class I SAM-dependent methyltransferase [Planctomycetota bacterium]
MAQTVSEGDDKWTSGLTEEIQFWETYVATRGGKWPEEFNQRMNPNAPLGRDQRELINAPEGAQVEILDVGAGALTWLGKIWPGRTVHITAIDPLGHEYDRMLNQHDIHPPVRTIYGQAEEIVKDFGDDRFDMVFCRNAMDHSADPLKGIRNCLQAAKPGCSVLLHHFVNEAQSQQYNGLHQWNFDCRDGRFIIWSPQATIDVGKEVADLSDHVRAEIPVPNWHVAVLRKRGRV